MLRTPTPEERALVHLAPISRRLTQASLIYLTLGTLLGLIYPFMEASTPSVFYLKAHIHLIVLGFFTFLIYGMAYHMLPRFCHLSLRESWRTAWHERTAHAGLWIQTGGWLTDCLTCVGIGALFSWSSFMLFTMALWPILRHAQNSENRATEPTEACPLSMDINATEQ